MWEITVGIVVFVLILSLAANLLAMKRNRDELQESFGRAGSVAAQTGFEKLDDFLFAACAGNKAKMWSIAKAWVKRYGIDERGPVKLARDIFMRTWAKLRVDEEFGNEVRTKVVYDALGLKVSEEQDIAFSKGAARMEQFGWTKAAEAGHALAVHNIGGAVESMRSLFNELREERGVINVALRVSEPTLKVLMEDEKAREQIAPLIEKYHAQLQAAKKPAA